MEDRRSLPSPHIRERERERERTRFARAEKHRGERENGMGRYFEFIENEGDAHHKTVNLSLWNVTSREKRNA